MKAVQIIGGRIQAGAARGAIGLHRGLRSIGVESTALVQFGPDPGERGLDVLCERAGARFLGRAVLGIDRIWLRFYPRRGSFLFSPGFSGLPVWRHPAVRGADVVHLHWINEGFVDIRALGRVRQPVVWTLRDMWPFTGGCHYTYRTSCERYGSHCGSCPEIGSRTFRDIAWWGMRRKAGVYGQGLHPVAISKWLGQRASESSLLGDRRVRVIYNAVDTDVFTPEAQSVARARLGLPQDARVILFGAAGRLDDPRKGLTLLAEALERLRAEGASKEPPANKPVMLVVFGGQSVPPELGASGPVRSLGPIQDDDRLALAYSAADLFVAPSLQEAFGKTVAEAMACGTPVVAFDATGPSEIVTHGETGFLAHQGSSQSLYLEIKRFFDLGTEVTQRMRRAARRRAVSRFGLRRAAEAYRDLYLELLSSEGPA